MSKSSNSNMGIMFYGVAGVAAIAAFFLYDVFNVIFKDTIFKGYVQSEFKDCQRVPEIRGCADLAIHAPSGYAFVGCPEDYSTYKNFISFFYNPRDKIVLGKKSNLYSYNILNRKAEKLEIIGFPKDVEYFAHGSDVITDPNDSNLVHFLSVNHRSGGLDTVEHFTHKIGTSQIKYVESFASEALKLASNIAAISPTSFYYTQDLSHISGVLNYMESLGLVEGGRVMFRDEKGNYIEKAKGFKLTNGLSLSANQKTLYLAESFRGKIHVFDRNLKSNKLKLKDSVSLNFSPIGIKTDPASGNLYIAGIPIDLSIIDSWGSFGTYKAKLTKSVVARLVNKTETLGARQGYSVETLLLDDGSNLSSATSAARDSTNGAVLVTGIFNYKGLLDCRV